MNIESPKPYKLEFEERAEYLYAYISGESDSLDISRRYWREIADECRRIKCGKVLIVEDLKEVVSTMDAFQISSEIPNMGFFGVRIAFVDRYIEHSSINEFGEIVATNRGLHGKVFNNLDQAEKWLLSD
jgi:hypothetical protein